LLPKGTHVIPAKITKEILDAPQYAWGTIKKGLKTGWTKVKSGVKNVASKVKDTAVGIWEYVQEPSKLLDIALETIGVEIPSAVSTIGKIARGGFNYVKDKAVGYIKDKVKEFMESVTVPAGKGAKAWRPVIYKAAARMGERVTDAEVSGIIAQIHRESGGNQKIIQSSAVWDVNTAAGNPARGLLQYIPQTFNAYKVPGHGNIYSGYDQLLAFFNNKNWRKDLPYGRRGWGPTGGRKYKRGGIITKEQIATIGEDDKEEVVIPLERYKNRATDLFAYTGARLGVFDDVQKHLRTLTTLVGNGVTVAAIGNNILKAVMSLVKNSMNRLIVSSFMILTSVNALNSLTAVNTKQLAWIAEGGWAESIISHDPSKRVRQQRIWQETGDRLGFTDDKYSKQMLAELERIARSVEAGQRNITKAIENKPVLSGSDIKQEYDRRDSKEAINHSIFTGRPRR